MSVQPHSGDTEEAAPSPVILVVEDEDPIRTIIKLSLEMNGYRLITAADSAEGLRLAGEYQGPIDLVITDMLLPGISGSHLIRTLLESRPGLNVIYISGYLGNEYELPASQTGKMSFLAKPFTPRQLLDTVRAVFAR